ncbi:MAG: SIMPL domain-containing protein [Methanophagales archaeon]|nr:SIMPL domain-containing protein [Methanophagales archaeon]
MMKKILAISVVVIFAICLAIAGDIPPGATAVDSNGNATISVSGRGIVSAEPNQVEIRLGVETEDKNVSKALTNNSLRMNATIEALKTLGISEDEIETSRFNIYPIRDYEREPEEIVGYRVTNEIVVKTADIDKTGEIICVAIDAGANNVRSVVFGLNETREKESKYAAINEACGDAKGKAGAIASGFGLNIVRVVEVKESSVYVTPCRAGGGYYEYALQIPTPIAPPIEPGEIEVSATIDVVYECR